MKKIINSNCKKCVYYKEEKCNGEDKQCMCKYCPRNIEICSKTRWCRETESPAVFD
jgi:hypothetical protein